MKIFLSEMFCISSYGGLRAVGETGETRQRLVVATADESTDQQGFTITGGYISYKSQDLENINFLDIHIYLEL